jgi:predicted Zn-dependent peptidase
MRTVDNVFDEMLFGKEHPLGRTILGPKENIRAFTRKDFTTYLKRNYTPLNTVVCVAGSFNDKQILAKIKRDFGTLSHGNPPNPITASPEQSEPRVLIKEKKSDQSHFILGLKAYPYLHKDEYALEVLSTILGGGMSSRLFMEVREKRGLAYSVHSWTDKYPDTGYFAVQAGVEHAKLELTIKTILAEFDAIKKKKVPASELKKAKEYMKGTMTLAMETSDAIAGQAATSVITFGRIRTLEEKIKAIDAVTASDIQRVARDIFHTNKLNLAIIGPHSENEKFAQLLK